MVGGAAYYAGRRTAQGDQRESDQQMRLEQLEAQQRAQQYAPPPQYAAPPPQYAAPPAAATQKSAVEQLTDLKQLLDAGVLTQPEFETAKAKILQA
jgi:hypothetical protein